MHLIPDTWPHLHMLISVFPLVGLIFVLCFYVTSVVTKNQTMQWACLGAIGVLGVIAIPTYLSGDMTLAKVAADTKRVSADITGYHYAWSIAALVVLVVTGAVAGWEALRSMKSGRVSNNIVHLVLGLSFITLMLMIVTGETGWESDHPELHLATRASPGVSASDIPEGVGTPQAWSHVHMILNHFPTIGFVITLAFFIYGLMRDNTVIKRTSLVLFAACGILGAPTYVTGAAAMWALTDPPILEITKAAINAHRDMAILSLFGLAATGASAYFELWRYRYRGRFSKPALNSVLVLAIVTLGIMAETGHRGGLINHPEIRTSPMPTDPNIFWSPNIENLINNVIWFVPWQTIHFFGYSLVFGTVLAVVLRVLGFWKAVPFSAVHRLLPLGVFGVIMNVFTGMLMLMADTYRYVNETSFIPKMFFLPIGAIVVMYFSLSDSLWNVKAGEDAPITAKWFAVILLISWIGVIMGGRLLPYV